MNTEDVVNHVEDGTEQPLNATPMTTERAVDEVLAEYGGPAPKPSYEAAPVVQDEGAEVTDAKKTSMARILVALGLTVGALGGANLAGLGENGQATDSRVSSAAASPSFGGIDSNPRIMRAGGGCDRAIELAVDNAGYLILGYIVISILGSLKNLAGGGKALLWLLAFPVYGPYKLIELIVKLSREAGTAGPGQPAQLRSAQEILADFNLNGGTAMERLNVDANPGSNFRQKFTQLFGQMRQAFGNFRFANPAQGAELFERLAKWLYIELRLEDIKANGGAAGPAAPQALGGPAAMRVPRPGAQRPAGAPARRMTAEEESQALLASKRELLENMIDDDLPLTEIPRTAIEDGSLERALASAATILRSKGFTAAQITEIHDAVRRYLTVAPAYRPGNSFRDRRGAEMKRTVTGPVAARAGAVVARFEGDALTYPAGRPNAGAPISETIDFGSAEIATDIRQRATNLPALRRRGPLRTPYHGANSLFPKKSKMRAGLLITLALASVAGAGYGGYRLVKWIATPSAPTSSAETPPAAPEAPAQPARDKAAAADQAVADAGAEGNQAALDRATETLKALYLRAKARLDASKKGDPNRAAKEEEVKRLEDQLRKNRIDPSTVKPKTDDAGGAKTNQLAPEVGKPAATSPQSDSAAPDASVTPEPEGAVEPVSPKASNLGEGI